MSHHYRDPYGPDTRRLRRVLRWLAAGLAALGAVVTLLALGDDDDDDDDDRDDDSRGRPGSSLVVRFDEEPA